jgi:NADPH-dependent curcumin reductase CurA
VDVYFENVGGPVTAAVVERLNKFARIPVCGLVGDYNATSAPTGIDRLPGFLRRVLSSSLTVRGFIQDEFRPTHEAAFYEDMPGWVRDGSVQYVEDVVDGLENAIDAFQGLLTGKNLGKLLIRVAEDPTA